MEDEKKEKKEKKEEKEEKDLESGRVRKRRSNRLYQ